MSENTSWNLDETSTVHQTITRAGVLWCEFVHDSPMWPIHGQYQCRVCGRRYPVPWAGAGLIPAPAKAIVAGLRRIRRPEVVSIRSAVLTVATLGLLLASPLQSADGPVMDAIAPAAMAFARYTAGMEQAEPWSVETVDIDAALPKLEEKGRLRAIRRLLPFGKPEYQVLELAGDRTVKQQVIVRYLSSEVRAAAIPASSLAITLANYNFRYKGAVATSAGTAYAFLITPRKKREGLIKGELWLDGETGAIVRQSGYLVKKPSIFVKRVELVRETLLRDGVAEARVTHLSVDTRLVGRAELTIYERPGVDSDPRSGWIGESR